MNISLPVPLWNNKIGQWEPVDFAHGQRVVTWPENFDPHGLPIPEYHEGDRVQFVRDETCSREGVVRLVLLQQGRASCMEKQDGLNNPWYINAENILYIVTARGHDHRIRAENILGRFLSLERSSCVFPLRE